MRKKGKRSKNRIKKPALLILTSAFLLLLSTVGSTRAALSYVSASYTVPVTVSSIGVSLLEDDGKSEKGGEIISYRNYNSDSEWETKDGTLLDGRFDTEKGGERLVPGKVYDESLRVANSGQIESYVRLIIKKSWKDASGKKDTSLSPDLIELTFADNSGWIEDTKASTPERKIYYYTLPLAPQAVSAPLFTKLKISGDIMSEVKEEWNSEETVVKTSYRYNGYSFDLAAEVDAVQTHNAQDAIGSAWGVKVNIVGTEERLELAQ